MTEVAIDDLPDDALNGADVANIQEGDVFVYRNAITLPNGTQYDITLSFDEFSSTVTGNDVVSFKDDVASVSHGSINIRNFDGSEDDYITTSYTITVAGSSTDGNPAGTAVEFDQIQATAVDVDNNEAAGFAGFDSISAGPRLVPASFTAPTGFSAYEVDATGEPSADPADTDFHVVSQYNDSSGFQFLFGATRGSGVDNTGRNANMILEVTLPSDTDGDGIADHLDLDSDNDGISDLVESGQDAATVDTDSDGVHDGAVNASGVATAANKGAGVTTVDSDVDGTDDHLDLDSDNDGIADVIEAHPTGSLPANDGDVTDDDADGDGIIDLYDSNDATTGDFGGSFVTPVNTDGTGDADYLDTDSDDDGFLDSAESGVSSTTDATYADVNGSINDPANDLTNSSASGDVDYREVYNVSAVTDGNAAPNQVIESASVGTAVGITGSATDLDASDDVAFSLTDDDSGNFAIDSGTGVVTVAAALDAADGTTRTITVRATSDDGSTSDQTFAIQILLDTDGDGVSNASDLDDDNDGILDTVERGSSLSTEYVYHLFNPGDDGTLDLYLQEGGLTSSFIDAGGDGGDVKVDTNLQASDVQSITYANGWLYALVNNGDEIWVASDPTSGQFEFYSASGVPTGTNNLAYDNGSFYYLTDNAGTMELWQTTAVGWAKVADTTLSPSDVDDLAVHDGVFYAMSSSGSDQIIKTTSDPATTDPWTDIGTNSDDDASFGSGVTSFSISQQPDFLALDSDSDGTADYLDLDSDNDGIADNVEGQSTSGYISPDAVVDSDGVDTAYTGGLTPVNTDTTGAADYLDTDSDDDGFLDSAESGVSSTSDATYADVNGSINDPANDLTNSSASGDVDYREVYNVSAISDANLAPNQVIESASVGTAVGITGSATDLDASD